MKKFSVILFAMLLISSCSSLVSQNKKVMESVSTTKQLRKALDKKVLTEVSAETLRELLIELGLQSCIIVSSEVGDRPVSVSGKNRVVSEILDQVCDRLMLSLGPDGDVIFISDEAGLRKANRNIQELNQIEDDSLNLKVDKICSDNTPAGDLVQFLDDQRVARLNARDRKERVAFYIKTQSSVTAFELDGVSIRTCLWTIAVLSELDISAKGDTLIFQ